MAVYAAASGKAASEISRLKLINKIENKTAATASTKVIFLYF